MTTEQIKIKEEIWSDLDKIRTRIERLDEEVASDYESNKLSAAALKLQDALNELDKLERP